MSDLLLQKAPIGLTGLFDLKLFGQQPDRVSGTVQPYVDAADHYLLQNMQTQQGQNAACAIAGDGVSFQVPNGQVWRLRALAFRINALLADGQIHIAIGFKQTANGVTVPLGYLAQSLATVATATVDVVRYFERPLLIQSGGSAIGQLEAPTAAARTGTLSAMYEVIPQ